MKKDGVRSNESLSGQLERVEDSFTYHGALFTREVAID